MDVITLKVIGFFNDRDTRYEPSDNQIELPIYSSFSNTSKSSSSSSSWSSTSSPIKRKKFSMEISEANPKLENQNDKVSSVSEVAIDQSRDLGKQGANLPGPSGQPGPSGPPIQAITLSRDRSRKRFLIMTKLKPHSTLNSPASWGSK